MSHKLADAGDWGPGVKTLVSPKSEENLPTDIDREKQVNLPAGAATPGGVSDDSNKRHDKRDVPKYEYNRPDNGIPDRPRTLPTPGEDYGHPVKEDYNYVTRRDMDASGDEDEASVERVVEAYQRKWRPGQRQRKQKGISKHKRQQYYRKNRNKIRQRAKARYRKTRRNPQFKRVQKHRRQYPSQHQRRRASPEAVAELYLSAPTNVPSPLAVAAMYLEAAGHDFNPPKRVPPPAKKQRRQRGDDRVDSRKDYIRHRPDKNRAMRLRNKRLRRFRKFKDYKKWYNEEYRRHGERGFRRRGSVLTTPQIEFVIGAEMVEGVVHSVSPMTGMVTFVVLEKDWEHLHSLPAVAFMESVVFLSEADIDAFFDLIDVEIGLEAYEELDEDVIRECAEMFDIDPDTQQFADQCEALTGQADLGAMTADQLGTINDVLVTGYLEGGHTRKIDERDREERTESGDEGELYDWHLIYGEVDDPEGGVAEGKTAEGITIYMERETPKDEIDHPASDVGYDATSPSHYRSTPDEKAGVPKGETGPDKHLDEANPASGRVVPPGDGQLEGIGFRPRTATTMDDIARATGPDVHARARAVPIRLSRADPKQGIWTFQAQGSKGRTYTIRVKGLRKGNLANLAKAQVKCSCSCDFFRWQGPEHWAKTNDYLYGRPRGTATSPTIKDPKGRHWACKHLLAALNLARRYRFSSVMADLADAELIPDFEWADQWGGSVLSVADRFLDRG